MFKKITACIRKLDEIVLAIFTRMKVFYQILLIISLMIIFLIIQGYMGLNIIDNMQAVTQKVFNTAIHGTEEIDAIKDSLTNVRTKYLENAMRKSNMDVVLDSTAIQSQIDALKSVNQTAAKQLELALEDIKILLAEPPTETGYDKLSNKLSAAQIYLQDLKDAVKKSTLHSMGSGNQFSADSRTNSLVILIISTLIAVGIGLLIAASITRPLQAIIKVANSLAMGDLSQNIEAKGCSEAVSMVKGLNHAIVELRKLVRDVGENAEQLTQSCSELHEAANNSGKSASEVATAMEELAQTSTEQTVQIDAAVHKINLLAELVKKVSADAEKIAAVSASVAGSAQLGKKAANDVSDKFSELFDFTKDAELVINELYNTSEEITKTTAMIRGIAEQTSLLALNAAIEAARAGEHGKGFGVVAVETGKLADQSKQAAGLIADIIERMRERTEQAVEVMQRGINKAEAGKVLASETNNTFDEIFQALNENLKQIEMIAKSTKKMDNYNEEAIMAVTTFAAFSEEAMANTQEVSAITEEQSALAQQVTALAENLSHIAAQLKQSVSLFEI